MVTRQELLKYADTLYELKDSEFVKAYLKAQHEIVTYFHSQEENVVKSLEYYKSSKKYDYYIELPYEKFEVLANGKYGFRQHNFSYCGKGVGEYKNWSLSGCCSLCNFTKEKIKDMINKRIKEDNEEVIENDKKES